MVGIFVGKSSWKEREVEKFQVGKSEVGKFLFKLERDSFHFGLSNLKLSNFSFFPTALSNNEYPRWSDGPACL